MQQLDERPQLLDTDVPGRMLASLRKLLKQGRTLFTVTAQAGILVCLLGLALWLAGQVAVDYFVTTSIGPASFGERKKFLEHVFDSFFFFTRARADKSLNIGNFGRQRLLASIVFSDATAVRSIFHKRKMARRFCVVPDMVLEIIHR